MPITKPSARKLATQLEWTLLESSYAPMLKEITLGRLKQKITRARKYQDKYRALARQQRGEARGKRKAKGTRPSAGNERTVQKQTLFTEARERFELQLEKLEAREKRARGKTAKRTTSAKRSVPAKPVKRSTTAKTSKASASANGADTGRQSQAATGLMAKRAELDARKAARQEVSENSRFARKQGKIERTGATAHQAHAGSRGRRRQAHRDSH